MIIGIADYPFVPPLPSVVLNDAKAIANVLQRPDRAGYLPSNMRLLLNEQATRQGILDSLQWLADTTTPEDTAVVYFSGHGHFVTEGPDAGNYLITYDTKVEALRRTALPSTAFTDALRRIRTRKLIVLLDACHSGGAADVKRLDRSAVKSALSQDAYEELRRGAGRIILASSRPNEFSYVAPAASNSLFTQCLLEALDGEAEQDGDGYIRVFEVVAYVFREVPRRHPFQHPVFKVDMMDENFALALFRGGEKGVAKAVAPLRAEDLLRLASLLPLADTADQVAIRDFIASRLSLDEMELMCADVRAALEQAGYRVPLDLETVGARGVSKQLAAQRLVEYLNRRGLLPFLVQHLSAHFQFRAA